MGKVCLIYDLMPEGVETDLTAVEEALKSVDGFDTAETKEVAFGLKKLSASFLFDDKANETGFEGLEEELSKLPGIQSIEQTVCTLV